MIHLAFRLDDPSATSDQEIEAHILESLERYGLAATFAVIPYKCRGEEILPLTRERAQPLRDAAIKGTIDIALHGYMHRDAHPGGLPSEFTGVTQARQREMILSGKGLLETLFERAINGFVPPFNSFDAATLDVLEDLGFDHISSNMSYAPMQPTRLRMLPLTCHLPQLKAAINEARRFARMAPVVTVVMHHYDFPGGDKPIFRGFDEFDALLAWVAAQADVRVKTLGELAGELSAKESQRCFSHRHLRDRLPWRFRHWLPDLCCTTRPFFLP